MAKPLLYKPPPRWQFWAALGGALLIHIGAVIASMKREPPAVDLSNIPTAEVTATLEAQEQPTPPPEDIPLPPPPPEPQVQPEFHEEQATPPPRQAQQKVAAPIKVAADFKREGISSLCSATGVSLRGARSQNHWQRGLCSDCRSRWECD